VCGRVVSSSSVTQLVDWLHVDDVVTPELAPSWNVAPGRELYVVADIRATGTRAARRLGSMRWGLVPSWSADPSSGPRPINARAESLLERPAFADAVAHRRCVVPVDGFYEWKRLPSGGRQPFFITHTDERHIDGGPGQGGPLVLAGLWDRWVSPDGEPLVTVAIVTVAANEQVAPLHDRMPAVLADPGDWDRWLDPATVDPDRVTPLLRPAAPGYLTLRPVDPRVNSVAHDDPGLLAEAEEPATLF
jgi:putative SOS response-associated peptidase YedK